MKYFLGSLEQAVMEAIWDRGPLTVREVVSALVPGRRLAYTTVMTVMNRLAAEGYLARTKDVKNSYRYSAQLCRDSFAAQCSCNNISALIERYGDTALAQFMVYLDRQTPEKRVKLKVLAAKLSSAHPVAKTKKLARS